MRLNTLLFNNLHRTIDSYSIPILCIAKQIRLKNRLSRVIFKLAIMQLFALVDPKSIAKTDFLRKQFDMRWHTRQPNTFVRMSQST